MLALQDLTDQSWIVYEDELHVYARGSQSELHDITVLAGDFGEKVERIRLESRKMAEESGWGRDWNGFHGGR